MTKSHEDTLINMLLTPPVSETNTDVSEVVDIHDISMDNINGVIDEPISAEYVKQILGEDFNEDMEGLDFRLITTIEGLSIVYTVSGEEKVIRLEQDSLEFSSKHKVEIPDATWSPEVKVRLWSYVIAGMSIAVMVILWIVMFMIVRHLNV